MNDKTDSGAFMMKNRPIPGSWFAMSLFFSMSTLLVSCSSSSGPTYTAAFQEGQTAAQEMLSQNKGSAIAIALVNRDQIVWTEAFGFADQEEGIAPSDTTMFSMASASKMFAAVAVMQLVEKWSVDLEKPFFSYVHSFSMADSRYKNITVRMLLNHSSSLPGTDYRNVQTTSPRSDYLDQVLESLSHERLKAEPGYTNVYCNDGFTLIEALVRAVTGKSYSQFVQDEIFTPLGMNHTRFALEPFADGTFAKAYTNGIPQPQDFLNALASGGAYSTPSDMGRIARMFLGGGGVGALRILSPESVSAMAEDQTNGSFHPARSGALTFGLGWDTVLQPGLRAEGVKGWLKGGDTELGHYGVALLIAPDEGLAVIVMGASGFGSTAATAIAERVMLRALAENGRISGFPKPLAKVGPAPAPVPDGLLAGIAGVYAGEAGLFRLEPQSDGSLALMMGVADPATATGSPLAWSPINLLTYRSDGTFAADSNPLDTLRVVSAGDTQFLIRRKPDGYGHYLDESEFGQRVTGTGGTLSSAWSARLENQWLLVNDIPESVYWPRSDPRLRIAEIPEVPGRIALLPCGGAPTILDPSSSGDVLAGMMLPTGRDIDDLDVMVKSDGEWLRYGSYLHRPLSTVPLLSSGISPVPIGPEGYAEWRSVAAGSEPVALSMAGVRAWSLYGPDFTRLGSGGSNDRATLPGGTGRGYLQLYGTKGGSVLVTIRESRM